MKKKLSIPHIKGSRQMDKTALRAALLNRGCHVKVDVQSWDAFKVRASDVVVDVSLAYEDNFFSILYQVNETEIRAVNIDQQSSVHLDSCVEVFIGKKDCYVNLEFNPYGTLYSSLGDAREGRTLLTKEFFEVLDIWAEYPRDLSPIQNSKGKWEILVRIPMRLTGIPSIPEDLTGHKLIANLYKCGDKLKQPHFISWNKIETEKPDFYRSSYFGDIEFVK